MTSYSSAADVFRYTRDIMSGSSAFSSTTYPTLADVEAWLAAGYSRVNTALKTRGYAVPVSESADCYAEVAECETLYAAARAHMVRNVARSSPDQWTKGEVYMDQHNKALAGLLARDLSRAGLSPTSGIYAGGISQADKDTRTSDTDRIVPRFKRGQFDAPGVWYQSNDDAEE